MSEEEIIKYWKNSTTAQRFHELERLRPLKWGRKAVEPMGKTKIEIVPLHLK